MLYSEVVGQEQMKHQITNLIDKKHMPHAIMLYATEGCGGLLFAIATAQYIVCTAKKNSESCGKCSACIKTQKLQHPDIHFSFPVYKRDTNPPKSNDFIKEFREYIQQHSYGNASDWLAYIGADNKQGNITAEECRDIILKLQLRSFESEYKILIMWMPEYMGNAGNILLKQIEEPTAKTIMIFVTENIEKVIGTIQSRTQLFTLPKVQPKEIANALIHQQVDEHKAKQIASMCEGNYYIAQKLLLEPSYEYIQWLRQWLNAVVTDRGIEIVAWVESITTESKETQKKFLQYCTHIFEQYMQYVFLSKKNELLLDAEWKLIESLATRKISTEQVHAFINNINNTLYYIERNAHAKQLFHVFCLQGQEVFLKKV